jgi:hypothetical protein
MQDALHRLEELAGASKPPSSVALYKGSPAERKRLLVELEPQLQERGLTVLLFNARRHLSEPNLGVPLAQQLLLQLQDFSNHDSTVTEITNRLMEGLDQLAVVTRGTAHMGAMREFDAAMSKLLDRLVTQPPLVVLVQGVDMAAPGVLLKLIEFMASYLDLPRCMFVLALGERALEGALREQGGGRMPYTPQEFLEETFTSVVSIGGATAPQPGPSLDTGLEQKLAEVRAVAPEFHALVKEQPELFNAVERLVRGANAPELLKLVTGNAIALDAYNNGNLRALLAREPFFDPQPVSPPTGQPGGGPGVVTLNEGPQFEVSSGLDSESGADIASRRQSAGLDRHGDKIPHNRVFKVRELTGRKAHLQQGEEGMEPAPPRKVSIRKRKSAARKRKVRRARKQPAGEELGVSVKSLLKPVLAGDYLAAKELWTKIPELPPDELDELVELYVEETKNRSQRVRATAATALGAMARAIDFEMPSGVIDALLILTNDAVKDVKDAAVAAMREIKDNSSEPAFEHGVGGSVPSFTPVNTGSPTVRESGADLPTFMPVDDDAPTFKAVADEPSFEAVDEDVPVFQAVEDKKPKFKVLDN